MEVVDALQQSLTSTFTKFGEFLPKLLGAIVILIIGYIIAKIIKFALEKILRAVKFDNIADSAGINGYLAKGGMKTRASGLVAKLGYWIVMFTTLVTFFGSLGLTQVSELLNTVIAFIPNIIVGCILLVVGMYLANFVKGLVVTALKGAGNPNADLMGRLAHGGITFLSVIMVLNQIGIGTGIVDKIVPIILSAAGFALAIAFGLGGKDWAAGILDKYAKK